MTPCVSVVLPVYNVAPYIEATIASILTQTFTDFELLVLDDCSTDDTVDKVQSIRDPRLRLMRNPHNLGRAGTDNAALAYVRGQYIAKMDGDDLCHPERLAQQVDYLDAHPEVNIVGSFMQNFGASTYLNRYPTQPADTQVLTLFTLPTGNPSVMMRTNLFKDLGMHYDASLRQTEDYEFCARYLDELVIATIPRALVQYRVLPKVVKQEILAERARVAEQVQAQLFARWQLPVSAREQHIHSVVSLLDIPLGDLTLAEIEQWLCRLLAHNEQHPRFDPIALRQGLGKRWFEVCYTYPQPFFASWRHFNQSQLAAYYPLTTKQRLKMWAKSMRKPF